MEETIGKTELLKRLRDGRARLLETLERLTPSQMIESNAVGTWTVKAVLAHLSIHERRALNELRLALRGEPMPEDTLTNDRINWEAVNESKWLSLEEVRANWDRSFNRLVRTIESLSDADFEPTSALVQRLGDSVDGAVGNNTYEHYAEHEQQILQWMRHRGFIH